MIGMVTMSEMTFEWNQLTLYNNWDVAYVIIP